MKKKYQTGLKEIQGYRVAERREPVKLEPVRSFLAYLKRDGPSNLTLFEAAPALNFFAALGFWFVPVLFLVPIPRGWAKPK